MQKIKQLSLFFSPLAALLLTLLLIRQGQTPELAITAGTTLWCALWWVFEPVPIPFTSMLPLAVFPLFDIISAQQVAQAYGHWLILLLMGGFMISAAMAKSGAHRRIAMNMVRLFGGNSAFRLVMGFMAASALLSMWISNTATTLMLLPVALAVLEQAQKRLAVPLLLGIAYAASVGGLGTPIGTPPNLVFMREYGEQFGNVPGFLEWMQWGVPTALAFLPIMALWLTRNTKLNRPIQLPDPGRWRSPEVRVMIIFGLTALAWVTRSEPFGGWSEWLGLDKANDASVALLAVVALAVTPDGNPGKQRGRLLDWDTARKIPWGVLILFGGGIAIASAFVQTGLATAIADQLSLLAGWPIWLLLLLICLSVTFLTEITSNTATASLLMPVLAAAAVGADIDPRLLMIPAVMSASCAFMLPVATAPNAIIYGSGRIAIKDMVREGFVLNLIGALIISGVSLLLLQ